MSKASVYGPYNRVLGVITSEGRNFSLEMVKAGLPGKGTLQIPSSPALAARERGERRYERHVEANEIDISARKAGGRYRGRNK